MIITRGLVARVPVLARGLARAAAPAGTGGSLPGTGWQSRTVLHEDLDPRKAAEAEAAEFSNASSSEEVVAAERGPDPLKRGSLFAEEGREGNAAAKHAKSEATEAAKRVLHEEGRMGQQLKGGTRPRGGLEGQPNPT